MTTFRTIADSEVEANAPVTEALMVALRDNPAAMSEGATGAPKVVGKALKPQTAVDDGSTSLTFSGLGDFGGVMVFAHFTTGSGTDGSIEFSDDGTTYYGSTVVAGLTGTERATAHISVDFDTRRLRASTLTNTGAPQSYDLLVTGLSLACTHIRLTGDSIGAMILPLGGIV